MVGPFWVAQAMLEYGHYGRLGMGSALLVYLVLNPLYFRGFCQQVADKASSSSAREPARPARSGGRQPRRQGTGAPSGRWTGGLSGSLSLAHSAVIETALIVGSRRSFALPVSVARPATPGPPGRAMRTVRAAPHRACGAGRLTYVTSGANPPSSAGSPVFGASE